MDFGGVRREWLAGPEAFWMRQAGRLVWARSPEEPLAAAGDLFYRWFPGGMINAAENCLDVHLAEGRGDTSALIFDSPQTGVKDVYPYRRLHQEVVTFAGALAGLGLAVGDTVLIFMPAVPQTVVAMLACARLGLTHSVVVTSVPAAVLCDRVDDARPTVILTASGGFDGPDAVAYQPLVEDALARARHQPEHCVVLQRPEVGRWDLVPGRDLDWHELTTASIEASPGPVAVPSAHPLYLLYTSGSTSRPKAVTRDTGGYLTALRWAVENVFGVRAGEVFWTDSHPGWVMGHSFTVYGALLAGATTVLYEGSPVDTPDPLAFPRIIAEYGVSVLFSTPMTLRRIRRAGPGHRPVWGGSKLRAVFLASERVEPELMAWIGEFFDCPVIDNWWQTETGWPIASNCLGLGLLPIKPGSVARPLPGYQVEILDEDGSPLPVGEHGRVTLTLPLPPGCLTTLWNDDQRFIDTYLGTFPGRYDTFDTGHLDQDGYLWIAGRVDDIINVGGDSLSGLDVEHVLAAHPDVERCAVVAAPDDFYTQVPVAFVVRRDDAAAGPHDLARQLHALVGERVGAWTRLSRLIFVRALTYTPSRKVKHSDLRAWLSTGAGLDVIADIRL